MLFNRMLLHLEEYSAIWEYLVENIAKSVWTTNGVPFCIHVFYCLVHVVDPCTPNHCQNGATCVWDSNGNPSCNCTPGFTGDVCERSK